MNRVSHHEHRHHTHGYHKHENHKHEESTFAGQMLGAAGSTLSVGANVIKKCTNFAVKNITSDSNANSGSSHRHSHSKVSEKSLIRRVGESVFAGAVAVAAIPVTAEIAWTITCAAGVVKTTELAYEGTKLFAKGTWGLTKFAAKGLKWAASKFSDYCESEGAKITGYKKPKKFRVLPGSAFKSRPMHLPTPPRNYRPQITYAR